MAIKLTSKDETVTFAVRVQPRASKNAIAGEVDGALKLRLAAPPVDGEANDELARFLAKLFGVTRQQIEIVSGSRSKNKIVRVSGISAEQGEQILNRGRRETR
ncbi:MAG TPA: DUF167 domain-containing protein [Blastocatellia bacterium]|nr:DUF167 domain-containing protein [Blastocatellia bacterium]